MLRLARQKGRRRGRQLGPVARGHADVRRRAGSALNHQRYAEEVAKGLHDRKKARTTRAPKPADAEGLF